MKFSKLADQVWGEEPDDQVRSFVFMSNLDAQETANTMDVSVSVERIHADLCGNTELASELHYAPDEWDEAQGWVKINYPLIDDTASASLDVVLDATFQPLPGQPFEGEALTLIDALLHHAENVAASNPWKRTTFHTAHMHPPGGDGDCDYCMVLQRRGYIKAHEEIQQTIPLPSGDWSAGEFTVVDVEGTAFPSALIPSIVELQHRAALDVPHGNLSVAPAQWDEHRLAQQSERILKTGTKLFTVLFAEGSTVAAMSSIAIPPGSNPDIAEQGLTIVHPDFRGRGLGTAVKLAGLSLLSRCHPEIQRVATSNAVDNHAMLAINRSIGATEIARTTLWEKKL
ncbi:MAG TPA: GNAT family N-acetyltransferase [Corynebacterium glutamicum]|nr:GNAT family N-acetyltransferase [Corynebacterium glutamicum]